MLLVSKNNIIPLLKILFLSTSHRLTRTIQYRELATKETCIRKKKILESNGINREQARQLCETRKGG